MSEWNLPGLWAWLRVAVLRPRNIVPGVAIVVAFLGCLIAYVDAVLGVIIVMPAAILLAVVGVIELRESARRQDEAELRRAMAHAEIR
jgi:uncharacterized membrane protein